MSTNFARPFNVSLVLLQCGDQVVTLITTQLHTVSHNLLLETPIRPLRLLVCCQVSSSEVGYVCGPLGSRQGRARVSSGRVLYLTDMVTIVSIRTSTVTGVVPL